MKKFEKTVNMAPTDKQLDKLWMDCVKARAGYKCEVSRITDGPICGHHIFRKPNHRLRWALEFGICLSNSEHARYHEFEKRAFPSDRAIADGMRNLYLKVRGETEEKALMMKRQSGGVDKIALRWYLKQTLSRYQNREKRAINGLSEQAKAIVEGVDR